MSVCVCVYALYTRRGAAHLPVEIQGPLAISTEVEKLNCLAAECNRAPGVSCSL